MQEISNVAELKSAIQLLEAEQDAKWTELQREAAEAFESLKPINLIKDTLKEVSSSPYLLDNIIGTGVGMATGFISRKILVGPTSGLLKRLVGMALQFSVTNLVAHNPDGIMKAGRALFQTITGKKPGNSEKQ